MTERFLVVRLGSLGDIVHTFPAVAGLRESFPKGEIVWLTHPRWKTLVASSQLATEIWEVETRAYGSVRDILNRIRKAGFTAAIDYQGLWKSAALPFLGRVPRRIGFSPHSVREFGVPLLYTDRVRSTQAHIADQNGELSQRAGALRAVAPFALCTTSLQEDQASQLLRDQNVDRYIVLSPAGGWRSKCWPAERYGALCQRLHKSVGLRCVLNQGPGDEECIAAVKAASGDSAPIVWHGSLEQLMILLRDALYVVAGDTGPLHLAAALGTPVVALFGPTDPARNGPYSPGADSGKNTAPRADSEKNTVLRPDSVKNTVLRAHSAKNTVLRSPRAVTTYKRRTHPDPSLLDIEVDAVFDAVRRQVEAHR